MTDIDHERQREEFKHKLIVVGGLSGKAAAFVVEQVTVAVQIESWDIVGSGSSAKVIKIT
jgi:hypothetical protein